MINWTFDLDEIICDFTSTLLRITNEHFNLELTQNDLTEYNLGKVLGVEEKEARYVIDIASQDQHLSAMPVLLDGLTLIKKVKKTGCNVFIVTAREDSMRPATEQWLKKHKVPYDNLYTTNGQVKTAVVEKLKTNFFVEDNLSHAIPAAEIGIKVFCPKYPWNTNKTTHSNIHFINNCSEIFHLIDSVGNVKQH